MNGGKDSEEYTVGYRYYVGIHAALCVGEIDGVFKVSIDDKEAWAGRLVGTGRITINKWELFGGDSREGGIKGDIDILTGSTMQGSNDYLAAKLGATNIPSFRGVCSVVLRQIYMGINPYLKKWVWRVQRIHKTSAGATQWYDEKAGIPVYAEIIPPGRLAWRYKVVGLSDTADYSAEGYDDSGWGLGYSPFADKPWTFPGDYNFPTAPSTIVPQQKKVWVRSTITIDGSVPDSFFFDAFVDNGVEVWINGAKALSDYDIWGHYYSADIPGSFFVKGANQITVLGRDDSLGVRDSNWFWFDFRLQDTTKTYLDMNPAHIIRECFVDQVWGYGVDAGEIDDEWFASSADALFNDATGLSFFLQSNDIDSFVQTVLEHIDAVIRVDNQTGKIQLKLIRGDYDADDLLELNPSNIESVSDYSRPSPSELINEVVVKYWDHSTGNEATLTIQDIGRIQAFGGVISTTKDFTGASNFAVAAKLGQRYLKNVGADRVSCSIAANRVASALQKGDVFRLSWPKYGVESMVMRVISIDCGDGVSNKITIKCTQDTFALPDFSIVSIDDGSLWSDPKLPPAAAGYRVAFEVPYYELVRRQGQDAVDERLVAMPEAGYIGVACVSPTPATINARIWTDSGAGYAEYGSVDFCPSATLAAAIGYIDTVIAIENGVDLDLAATGTWAQIDDELVAIDAISDTSITIRRGVLDTVPAQHSAGARIFLWSGYSGGDRIEYVAGEEVDIKLLPVTGSGVLALSEAPVDTVTLNERAIRPYPPGNVQVNGASYPTVPLSGALTVTWAHRDRTQQTAGILQDYTYGDIGPETGTTYNLRIYSSEETLVEERTGITTTSASWSVPGGDEIIPVDLAWTKVVDADHNVLLPPALTDLVETFAADTGQFTKYSEATPGTTALVSNTYRITHGATQNDIIVQNTVSFSMPQIWVEAQITVEEPCTVGYDNAGVGIVKDANNFLIASMDRYGVYVRVQIKIGGVNTFLASLATTAWPSTFKLGMALVGNSVTVYTDTGSGWTYRTGADVSSKYDFRTTGNLTGWRPGFTLANGANACVWNFANFKAGRFGGVGIRDHLIVTNEDGSPYFPTPTSILFSTTISDRLGVSCCGIFSLDLTDYSYEQVGVIMVERGGKVYNDLIAHIIYYAGGDRRITMSTWGNGLGGSLQVLHKLETSQDLLSGTRVVAGMTQLNLPGQTGALPGAYDQMLAYDAINSRWLIAYTVTDSTNFTGDPFYPAAAYSVDLSTWTLIGKESTVNGYEGTKLLLLGGEYWVLAGGPAGTGDSSRVYNSAMVYQGPLDVVFEGGNNTQPHPMVFPYGSKQVIISFDDTRDGTALFTWGNFLVYEAARYAASSDGVYRVELESVRDGIVSFQKHDFAFQVSG